MRNFDLYYKYKKSGNYASERNEIANIIPNNVNSWLDVGCGAGGFGINILNINKDILLDGVEPDKEKSIIAKTFFDTIYECHFENETLKNFNNKKYDIISFLDVLEHVLWPSETINLASKLLNENGKIIASIPNILYFEVMFKEIIIKSDWQYKNSGTLDYTHFRFFTKKSIIRMFENCGYEIQSINGINPCKSKMFKCLNFILFNKLEGWKYLQYVIVAKKK